MKATRTLNDALEASALLQKYNYVYGAKYKDNPLSYATLVRLRNDNSQVYSASYFEQARKFIGTQCIDCSGLVCHCLGISDIGSWAIHDLPITDTDNYKYTTKAKKGDIVWREGHVGFMVNDNQLIEAKGINFGVVFSKYVSTEWKAIIRPAYVNEIFYENIGWNRDSAGWWYAYGHKKGEYYRSEFKEIDNDLYYFDEAGYCLDNITFHTDAKGAIVQVTGTRHK